LDFVGEIKPLIYINAKLWLPTCRYSQTKTIDITKNAVEIKKNLQFNTKIHPIQPRVNAIEF